MRFWLTGLTVMIMASLVLAQSPATQPADPTDPTDPTDPFAVGNATIRLPDGREVNLADLQGGGMSGVFVMKTMGTGDNTSVMAVDEQGRKISIKEGDDEIVVTVREGDKEPVEYKAANADELKEKHPEAFDLYERYARPEFAAAIQQMPAGAMGDRIQLRLGGPMGHGIGGGQMVELLGTTVRPVMDEFVKSQLGVGIVVTKVPADSLAATLGLQKHDLMKSVNDKPVETIEQLEEALETADQIKMVVIRAGKAVTIEEK